MPSPKIIYLYTYIYDGSVKDIMQQIDECMGDEVTIRENTGGGSVFATVGLCDLIAEHGNVTIDVQGIAASSGANLLPYAKKVTCLDISTFLLHRADMYVESEEEKALLAKVNKDLRAKLELRVNADVFKDVTGYTLDQMFDPNQRLNIWLDAKQAKKIGLVDKVRKLEPAERDAINARFMGMAAEHVPTKEEPSNKKIMTKGELLKDHPAIYAEIVAEGVAKEKDRVESCLVFAEVDLAGVKAAIASGQNLSAKQMSEFSMKIMSKAALGIIEGESPAPAPTGEEKPGEKPKTETEKSLEAFEKLVDSNLNIGKK